MPTDFILYLQIFESVERECESDFLLFIQTFNMSFRVFGSLELFPQLRDKSLSWNMTPMKSVTHQSNVIALFYSNFLLNILSCIYIRTWSDLIWFVVKGLSHKILLHTLIHKYFIMPEGLFFRIRTFKNLCSSLYHKLR